MPVRGGTRNVDVFGYRINLQGNEVYSMGDYRKNDLEEEEECQRMDIPKSCLPPSSYHASLLLAVRILLLLLMASVCISLSMCKISLTVWSFTKSSCSLNIFPFLPFFPVTLSIEVPKLCDLQVEIKHFNQILKVWSF